MQYNTGIYECSTQYHIKKKIFGMLVLIGSMMLEMKIA